EFKRETIMTFLNKFALLIPLLALGTAGSQPLAVAAPAERGPDAKHYDEQVRPFLVKHCLGCHGGEKPKGDFRLDKLPPDFTDKASRERWLAVVEQLQAGAMPPKAKPRPPEKEVQALADWISGRVATTDAVRRDTQGRGTVR